MKCFIVISSDTGSFDDPKDISAWSGPKRYPSDPQWVKIFDPANPTDDVLWKNWAFKMTNVESAQLLIDALKEKIVGSAFQIKEIDA